MQDLYPRRAGKFAPADLPVLRIALLVALSLTLFWLILSRSLVAYLATAAPHSALLLRPGDAATLLILAERELNSRVKENPESGGQSGVRGERWRQLRRDLETALVAEPLDAKAYRLLGQLTDVEQAEPEPSVQTARLMQRAVDHSLAEPIAAAWMMRNSYESKDFRRAAFYTDVLLRAHPQFVDYALPILARMAEDNGAKGELQKLLAGNPPWRSRFFNSLGGAVTDMRTPLDLLLTLKDSAAPPIADEFRGYMSVLFEHKRYDLAYYVWLQFQPPEQLERIGFLFNGSFESTPSGLPFDWQTPQGVNVRTEIAPRPDAVGKRALFLKFGPSRVNFPGVYQTVMLPPGAYKFKGSIKGEIVGRRGLRWSVSCLDGAPIDESGMLLGLFPAWQDFEFSFTTRNTDCRPQQVRLGLTARSASEQMVSGSIWFDELTISRRPADPTR